MCCRMGCIFERQNTCIHGQMSVTMLIQCTGCDTCINCMYDQADQSPALKLPNFTNCSLQVRASLPTTAVLLSKLYGCSTPFTQTGCL